MASKELVRRHERGGRHFLVVRHGPPIVGDARHSEGSKEAVIEERT